MGWDASLHHVPYAWSQWQINPAVSQETEHLELEKKWLFSVIIAPSDPKTESVLSVPTVLDSAVFGV